MENCGVRHGPVVYKKHILEILRIQGLMVGDVKVLFCSSDSASSNGDGVRFIL